jgi:aerobic C4-dicarboxylate transport protein
MTDMTEVTVSKPWYRILYVQVLIAIVLGALVGWLFPDFAKNDWIKALGDGFVKLIRMVIAPIIFCTVVSGISHISEVKKVGRVAVKALVYFEVVSSFALILGLIVANVLEPGAGFSGKSDAAAVASFAKQASEMKSVDFILHIIPDSAVGSFAAGDILQVLLFSVLFGFALMAVGDRGNTLRSLIDDFAHTIFGVIAIVVKAAPVGAFGAMAYTIGRYGPTALGNLAGLIATFYLTSIIFVVVVLGIIARIAGFSIFKYLGYIKDELLIVLGTSSSESVLPQLMEKMERLGCSKPVVGLFVQPRRHEYLHDLGDVVHRPGIERAAELRRADDHPGRGHAHLKGRQRYHRSRLHHAGRDARGGAAGVGSRHGDRARHR